MRVVVEPAGGGDGGWRKCSDADPYMAVWGRMRQGLCGFRRLTKWTRPSRPSTRMAARNLTRSFFGSPVVQRMFIANVIAELRRHIARSRLAVDPGATHGVLERQRIKPDDLKARFFSSSHGGTS